MTARLISLLLSLIVLLGIVLLPAPALAYNPFGGICGIGGVSSSSLCSGQGDSSQNPLTGTKGLIRGIADILAFVTGLGALVMIIIGGFRYITANGDANQAKSARATIIAAVIGLAIVALAETIISLVLGRVS